MNKYFLVLLGLFHAIVITAINADSNGAEFIPLGQLRQEAPRVFSVSGLSADGSTVTGSWDWEGQDQHIYEAFQWTRENGLVGLGHLLGENFPTFSAAISADGSTVFGTSSVNSGPIKQSNLFRWSAEDGITDEGNLYSIDDGSMVSTRVFGVTPDGTTAVGTNRQHEFGFTLARAFRWTSEAGLTDLGDLPTPYKVVSASAIAASGNVIVGFAGVKIGLRNSDPGEAFKWTSEFGMMSLGVPMGFTNSQAYELSADGSVIVGTAQGTGTIEKQAFRYTDELGIDLLDLLPDWRYSTARGVSDDGSIVIGFAQVADGSGYDIFRWTADGEYEVLPPPPELPTFDTDFLYASADAAVIVATSAGRPLIWRSGHGTRYVDEVLADDFGLADEIEGWQLSGEVGDIHVSADGTVIAGAGVNPSGIREPWVAILNPTGDFNRDGVLGVSDADLLVGQIVGGDHDTRFDLSNDDLVDNTDLRQWLSIAGIENGFKSGYLIGDANLDGTVNASDLNKVGLHWFQDPARWSAGDFTADGVVNVDDLNHVGQNWLQSVPSANAASAVPEPMTHLLIASAAVCLILVRRGPGT